MNNALYYPTIEFNNFQWLWSAALVWDNIYRIVPENYEPDDGANIKKLMEESGIGLHVHPGKYGEKIAADFVQKLESNEWDADALRTNYSGDADFINIHSDKIGNDLRNILIAKGVDQLDDWLRVPSSFGTLYMTYLAECMSKENNLHLVSDLPAAWIGSTYFKYDGKVEDSPSGDFPYQLANLVIKDFIPENITDVTTDQLIKFRRERKDERHNFMEMIKKASVTISECKDPEIIIDQINAFKKDVDSAVKEFKDSMDLFKVTGWSGFKSLSFPIVTDVATKIVPIDATSAAVLSGIGLLLGLIIGIKEYNQKRVKLNRESDYSYLLHVKKLDGPLGLTKYNESLGDKMNEFLYD
jgi:hypothetical protein